MKIAFIMMRHPPTRVSPIMPQVVSFLREWGITVDLFHPDDQLTDLAGIESDHDLYVLKSGTELALSLAGALDAAGKVILNPYPITEACRNKIIATRILQRAGVPTPETYVTNHPNQLTRLLDDGPLVVKPYRGSQGRAVTVVWDAEELDGLGSGDEPLFAQRFHEPKGRDRKIYAIGGQIFGVKRVWPAHTYQEKLGEPFTITPELHEIALRCGDAFSLDLYGLDVILTDCGPLVVDVSAFPGFKGVPDAALRLADYVYAVARRTEAGRAPSGPREQGAPA
jgi:ribosomal protein S6--L-glutamate ligase